MTAVLDETLHLVTGEYPPDQGGVSGYTAEVARGLAQDGAAVHVWCPGCELAVLEHGVHVHRALGSLSAADFRRADTELDAVAVPRRLIVQWVPHAFGRRSMNVSFCRWVDARSRVRGDTVELMVHEPFLDFTLSPRRVVVATVHRAMTRILLRRASRVWVSTPMWEERWRPYTRDSVAFGWVPIPATVPVDQTARLRGAEVRQALVQAGGCVIGSFSPAGPFVHASLAASVVPVIVAHPETALLLVGKGSADAREALIACDPGLAGRVHATGSIEADDVSRHLGACDLAVQPCPDGVCTRHSSVATLLAHGVPVVTTDGRFTEALWRETHPIV